MLAAQNAAREKFNLPPLAWDDGLSALAQEWANKIAASGVIPPPHRPNNSNGENFFWGTAGGFEPKVRFISLFNQENYREPVSDPWRQQPPADLNE